MFYKPGFLPFFILLIKIIKKLNIQIQGRSVWFKPAGLIKTNQNGFVRFFFKTLWDFFFSKCSLSLFFWRRVDKKTDLLMWRKKKQFFYGFFFTALTQMHFEVSEWCLTHVTDATAAVRYDGPLRFRIPNSISWQPELWATISTQRPNRTTLSRHIH